LKSLDRNCSSLLDSKGKRSSLFHQHFTAYLFWPALRRSTRGLKINLWTVNDIWTHIWTAAGQVNGVHLEVMTVQLELATCTRTTNLLTVLNSCTRRNNSGERTLNYGQIWNVIQISFTNFNLFLVQRKFCSHDSSIT
jgi:hypothetical protein